MSNELQLMPWVDVETFGLDPEKDMLIEVGIKVTDIDLNVITEGHWLIWGPYHKQRLSRLRIDAENGNENAQFVWTMHTNNGLFREAAEYGLPAHQVEDEIVSWMKRNEVTGFPMCGSSVDFDRKFLLEWMPEVVDQFHYRVIDNSTVKELCRRYNPELFKKVPEAKYVAPEWHRTKLCLEDTLTEFKFYRDEFLLW